MKFGENADKIVNAFKVGFLKLGIVERGFMWKLL